MDKKIKFQYNDVLNIERFADYSEIINSKSISEYLIIYWDEPDLLDYLLRKNNIKGDVDSSNIIIDLESREIVNDRTNIKGLDLSIYSIDFIDLVLNNPDKVSSVSEKELVYTTGRIQLPTFSKQVIRHLPIDYNLLDQDTIDFLTSNLPEIASEQYNLDVHFKCESDNSDSYYTPISLDFIKKVLGKPFLLDVNSKPLKYYSNFELYEYTY